MYEELIMRLLEDKSWIEQGTTETEHEIADHLQKAADAIEDLQEKLDDARMDASEWAESLEYMSAAKVELEEQTRWISVTERLPEIGEYVLAYLFNRSPYIVWIDRTGQWQTEEFWLDAEDAPKAWMSLPEPYEPPKEE